MKTQSGVALITAVLVSALAAILAAAMARDHLLAVHRTSNLFQAEQAWAYALGMERWARKTLAEDPRDLDAAGDPWAQALPPLSIEGGALAGTVIDLNSRFNVNGLVGETGPDELQLERFRRLLRGLSLDPRLADAVVDWIDADTVPRPGGAEDNEYLSRQPPYRAANRRLASASEMRAVAGIDGQAWRALEPHVTALPRPTAINVNTATPEVLLAVLGSRDRNDVERMVRARERRAYASVAQFMQDAGLAPDPAQMQGLDVRSDFFLARGVVVLGDIELSLFSVLYRDETGTIRTVARSQTVY